MNNSLSIITDANWNVVALASASGTVVERYTYNAFGKRQIYDASFTPRTTTLYPLFTRTFTSQVLDPETGLMLYRNRVYHPTLGRFIQRDPIGYEANDINFYRYVKNNVVKFVDSLGLYDRNADFYRDMGCDPRGHGSIYHERQICRELREERERQQAKAEKIIKEKKEKEAKEKFDALSNCEKLKLCKQKAEQEARDCRTGAFTLCVIVAGGAAGKGGSAGAAAGPWGVVGGGLLWGGTAFVTCYAIGSASCTLIKDAADEACEKKYGDDISDIKDFL